MVEEKTYMSVGKTITKRLTNRKQFCNIIREEKNKDMKGERH